MAGGWGWAAQRHEEFAAPRVHEPLRHPLPLRESRRTLPRRGRHAARPAVARRAKKAFSGGGRDGVAVGSKGLDFVRVVTVVIVVVVVIIIIIIIIIIIAVTGDI
jgi:hypothetical protein